MTHIDPDALKIAADPLPPGRAKRDKYADLWAKLKPGQCVVCEPEHVGRIAGALKKHVESAGLDCHVRLTKRYTDGKGRVWLLQNEKRLKRAA